jgi:hypothetical protein
MSLFFFNPGDSSAISQARANRSVNVLSCIPRESLHPREVESFKRGSLEDANAVSGYIFQSHPLRVVRILLSYFFKKNTCLLAKK